MAGPKGNKSGERKADIVSAEEYRRLARGESGQVLINALASSPLRDADFDQLASGQPISVPRSPTR
jgi:hypothetical protein